jgi:hypothetical protein
MKFSTRFATVAGSVLLCLAGIFIANSQSQEISSDSFVVDSVNRSRPMHDYQFASSAAPTIEFHELEAIIRRDPTAKQQHGKIEFGSVRLEQGTALAEVMFVSDDGRVFPFLYKLMPQRNSWKIVNVQRIWYVPRSHLLRGVRA